jgi:uncharacterized protein YecE (DUF72 family)
MIHVGTSGFAYPEWRGTFYPASIKSKEMFSYYAGRFRTVEINATFYRMPTVKLITGWREQAPPGFTYALKAPRRITHERRLKDCEADVEFFCATARELGEHMGPLLFQLPPTLKADADRLRACLAAIPAGLKVAFEFRHDSWLTEEIFAALAERGAALCVADFGDRTTPMRATARHAYFRLRDEGYTPDDLDRWAAEIGSRRGVWDEAFVYFKHEEEGRGPEFARAFIERLQARGLTGG